MERIKVRVETIDWTMGEWGHFDIIVRKNAYVTVDWGDGSPLQTIIGTGERQSPDHDYKSRLPIRQFEVVITSQEDGTILHYYNGFIDMWTLSVNASECPLLPSLGASWACQVNVKGCYGLTKLECGGENIEELDLTGCCNLETLNLFGAMKLRTLNLTPCPKLQSLECGCCFALTQITLSRDSRLQTLITNSAEDLEKRIRPAELRFIKQILHKNGGNIEYTDVETPEPTKETKKFDKKLLNRLLAKYGPIFWE